VIIPVLTQHYPMLQRNLLYTGLTRGKRLVILVGQKKAIAIAVPTRQAGGVGRNSTNGSGLLGQEAPPILPPRMIRLRSFIITEDSRACARLVFCGSRRRTSRQNYSTRPTVSWLMSIPRSARGSSTLSRDTGQRQHRHQTDDLWRAGEISGRIAQSVQAAICRRPAMAEKKATRWPFFVGETVWLSRYRGLRRSRFLVPEGVDYGSGEAERSLPQLTAAFSKSRACLE
jgi:hypothetical protein